MALTDTYKVLIYDTLGNLVDIPTDVLSGTFEDVVNGGSSQGTLIVPRRFCDAPNPFPSNAGGASFANPIGTQSTLIKMGFEYRVQFFLADSVTPWFDGRIVDYDPEDLDSQDREQITFTLEGWQVRLGFGILTESVNPGVQPNGVNNGSINADTYLTHLISTYQDSSTFGSAFVASIPVSLNQVTFDGTGLNKAIDTIVGQVQDSTGNTFEWWVRGGAIGTKPALVIQPNQNPNKVTSGYTAPGVTAPVSFMYEQSKSTIKGFKITNSSRSLFNFIALYGGKDPTTGQQIYNAYKDSTSISLYGIRQNKVTNSALISQTTLNNYGTVYLLLNGYPQPQATYKKLVPTDVMRGGKWVQIQSTATGSLNQSIFQMRALKVSVSFQSYDYIEQTVTAAAPRPYIDQAFYAAIANAANALAINTSAFLQIANQSYYIVKGFNWVANNAATAPIFTQPFALFAGGSATRSAVSTSLSGYTGNDSSGNPQFAVGLSDSVTGATGDGYYEVVFALNPNASYGLSVSSPDFVVVKGKAVASSTVLKGYSFTVLGGVIVGSTDQRVIGNGKAAAAVQQNYPAPTLSTAASASNNTYTSGISVGILVTAALNNVPQDGLVGGLVWFVRPTATGSNPVAPWASWAETSLSGVPTPPASQSQNLVYGGLTIGTSYDFGLAYVTTAGVASPNIATILANVSAGTIALPGSYLANNAGNASLTPVVSSGATAVARPSLSGVACVIRLTFTVTNQPTDGSLADIVILQQRTQDVSLGNYYTVLTVSATGAGSTSPPASASYVIDVANIPNGLAGTNINFAVGYQSTSGGISNIAYILTAQPSLVAVSVPYMLAGSSPIPTISSGGTPVFTSAVSGLSCTATFTNLTFNNQPPDGSLSQLAIFFRAAADSSFTAIGSIPAQGVGQASPSANGTYPTIAIGNLHNGTTYYFAFAYENAQGGLGGYATVGPFTATNVGIPTGYSLGGVTPPVLSNTNISSAPSANNITADVTLAFNITNQPTDGSLSRISYWYRQNTPSNNTPWSFYSSVAAYGVGTIPASSSPATGIYSTSATWFVYADLSGGRSYDFGVSFENAQGGESAVTTIAAFMNFTPTLVTVGTGQTATMPTNLKTNGPTISTAAFSVSAQQNQGTASVLQPITFTIGDWTAGNQPNWYAGLKIYYRLAYTHASLTHVGTIAQTSAVALSYSVPLPAGGQYDIGISYVDTANVESAIMFSPSLYLITAASISPPMTIAGTGNINLIPDGQLAHVVSSSNEAYWFEYLIDGVNFGVNLSPDSNTSYTCFYWKSGTNGTTRYANSPTFQLTSGVAYNLSMYADMINATGSMTLKLLPVTGTVSNTNPSSSATSTASVSQSAGKSGSVNVAFTPSSTGLYCVQISNAGASIGGSPIYAGAFQVMQGSAFTGFVSSTPVTQSGTTSHLAASTQVQSTVAIAPDVNGSYVTPGVVGGAQLKGGTVGDTAVVMNGTTLAQPRHDPTVLQASTGSQYNLVPDSDVKFGVGGPTTGSYWGPLTSPFSYASNANGNAFSYTIPSGGASAVNQPLSSNPAGYMKVASGVYALSAAFQTSNITDGSVSLVVLDSSSGTEMGRLTVAFGVNDFTLSTRHTGTITVASGTTSVSLLMQVTSSSANAGANVKVGLCQFEHGTLATGYQPNISNFSASQFEHGAMSLPTKSTVTSAVGVDGSYLAGGVVYNRHITGATQDGLNDGGTYARVLLSELASNKVARVNDGTNIRTASQIGSVVATGADGAGSFLQPLTVAARHLIGGTSNDTGAILDNTGVGARVLIARHALSTQIASTGAQVNLVADSDIKIAPGPNAYWGTPPTNFSTGVYFSGRMTFLYGGTSSASSGLNWPMQNSAGYIVVNPGQMYTISAAADTTEYTSGSMALIVSAVGGSEIGRLTWNFGYSQNSARVASTFTVPSGVTQVLLIWQQTWPGASGSFAFLGQIQIEQGSTATAYHPNDSQHGQSTYVHAGMSTGVQTALSPTGQIKNSQTASTFLNTQGSITPYTTDFTLNTSSPGGATYVKYYICGAGGSGTVVTIYRADGTQLQVNPVGTSASPIQVNVSTSGQSVFFLVYVPNGSSTFTVGTYTPNAPLPVMIAAAIGDGTLATVATASTYAVSGGGGGLGGGGGTGGCPELSQRLWMRAKGVESFAQARFLLPGDEVLGSDGKWKELHHARETPGEIWRVTFEAETITVDASHLFMDPRGNWVNVKHLRIGQELKSHGRDPIVARAVERVGMGKFMALSIDHPFAYQLGRTVSHNIKVK